MCLSRLTISSITSPSPLISLKKKIRPWTKKKRGVRTCVFRYSRHTLCAQHSDSSPILLWSLEPLPWPSSSSPKGYRHCFPRPSAESQFSSISYSSSGRASVSSVSSISSFLLLNLYSKKTSMLNRSRRNQTTTTAKTHIYASIFSFSKSIWNCCVFRVYYDFIFFVAFNRRIRTFSVLLVRTHHKCTALESQRVLKLCD
jgi:hypothetical protein